MDQFWFKENALTKLILLTSHYLFPLYREVFEGRCIWRFGAKWGGASDGPAIISECFSETI